MLIGGLFLATHNVFISNALLNSFLYTVNIGYWFAKFKRDYYSKQGAQCTLTQGQANKAFENPPFPVQTTSAAFINTLWYTAFYCSVLPIGIIFSLLSFIYEYFVLKVWLELGLFLLNFIWKTAYAAQKILSYQWDGRWTCWRNDWSGRT